MNTSAFGIVHKTYVSPGVGEKGYVKAKHLTEGMKSIVRNRTKNTPTADTNIPGRKQVGNSAKGRSIHPDEPAAPLGRRIVTDVLPKHAEHPNLKALNHTLLGHSKPNGRGGGILRMNTNTSPELQASTYRHELAHLKPRRNPVHFGERMVNEKASGREEGRADFIGNQGKKTPGQYPGTREFKSGYSDVQNNMARNVGSRKNKNKRFVVNSSGETVRKSAFGVYE